MNVTADHEALYLALGIDKKNLVKKLAGANFNGKIVNDGKLAMQKPDLSKIPVMHFFPKTPGNTSRPALSFEVGRCGECLHPPDARARRSPGCARLVEGRHTYVMHKKALACGDACRLQ